MFITVNRRPLDSRIRVSYSKTEIASCVDAIEHPLVREALRCTQTTGGIEITSISDVPAGSGMGSSGAFAVGLLHALHTFHGRIVPRHQLAEEACEIEIEKLGEPIGKHDQYIAAFGGVTCLEIDTSGKVEVVAARVSDDTLELLERNLLLFWTGVERNASEILSFQDQATRRNDQAVIRSLHEIKDIGRLVKTALEAGDVDQFGELLHEHWCIKKKLSKSISTARLDELYEVARAGGARGGKVIGAGGGGFLMLYASQGHARLREAMLQEGMVPMRFRFDHEGTRTLVNV